MSIEDQMREYARGHQAPYDAATWDQMCGSLMYRFNTWRGWSNGGPTRAISTATIAGDNSGPLNRDMAAAPAGAFHFIAVPGVPAGHVVQDAAGGGWRCFSTGRTAIGESLSPYLLGFLNVASYLSAKGATYRGWATNYAGGIIVPTGASTAGGGSSPINNTKAGERKMRLAWAESTGYLVTEDGWQGLPSPQIYNLFYRLINSDQSASPFANGRIPENFNRAEVDIMNNQLRLLRVANRVDVQIDGVKLASAISDELKKAGIPVTVENLQDAEFVVDQDALAKAFEAAVPRVAKAIVKEAGTAMSTVDPAAPPA